MDIDLDRRQRLIDMFPEACPGGQIDGRRLLALIGVVERPNDGKLDRELLHSIRNSIGVVQSGTRLLQRRLTEDADATQVLESIMNASQALKGYIDKVS